MEIPPQTKPVVRQLNSISSAVENLGFSASQSKAGYVFWDTIILSEQPLESGQTRIHNLYTLANHRNSMLILNVIIHDIDFNTSRKFFSASYAWYQDLNRLTKKMLLLKLFDDKAGSGAAEYAIDSVTDGNNIQVQIQQNNFDATSYYTVVAQIILASLW